MGVSAGLIREKGGTVSVARSQWHKNKVALTLTKKHVGLRVSERLKAGGGREKPHADTKIKIKVCGSQQPSSDKSQYSFFLSLGNN